MDFGRLDPDPGQGGQKLPTKNRKSKEMYWFEVLNVLFAGWPLLLKLGRSLWRPGDNILQFLII
jgi:hypothetical protein